MPQSNLERRLGLTGLAATGICSMLGASVYIIPFMIQRNAAGIGPFVIPAFIFAAIPAVLAAIAYASLATAMPVAGGSYIYASRGLSPYLGFIASFSQWFGLSIAIGVIAYVIVPFFRDAANALQWFELGRALDYGPVRVSIALLFLWSFVGINIRGLGAYQKTLVPLMIFMFFLGTLVIVVGFTHDRSEFLSALASSTSPLSAASDPAWNLRTFLSASAVLFASFIGFDSIAQAGSEARNPSRNLPAAIAITILSVGAFYILFTSAVYHTVPWQYVAEQALLGDITAPGLLSPVLTSPIAAMIILGAAVALINDLPAMLLSVSRLMFAWASDRIFPRFTAQIHPVFHTPFVALITSGGVASLGILGSHFAGDFFLGVDIMVTSMLVNFLLMCITIGVINKKNHALASKMTLLKSPAIRSIISVAGILFLILFLVIHISKDLGSTAVWYLKSTPVWLLVMLIGSSVYFTALVKLKNRGVDLKKLFSSLPQDPNESLIK